MFTTFAVVALGSASALGEAGSTWSRDLQLTVEDLPRQRRLLVRRDSDVRLGADGPNSDAQLAVAAADNNCECSNSATTCATGQYCLGSDTNPLCLDNCSFDALSATLVNYNGKAKCKCGADICVSAKDTVCKSEQCSR
eukprot:TRINITY_DN105192_c0_g1_i1.p1 TRINITY_DN105192_c0_g1~~TRINITY_DN105192_c0_g1_i1.p1  ORF type:complete len:139 (-),score=30.38 TRINITY_DN105192_c0_g1_i1:224-640(-)